MTDSVGARLRQARELRRLSLQEVSEATKVRTHYLQALENDDYSAIPSAAQARGFLRIYAAYLELDLAELLAALPREVPLAAPPAASEVAAPAAAPGLWASLRQRLNRGAGRNRTSTGDIPAAAAGAPLVSPVPEQHGDILAPTDIQVSDPTASDTEPQKKKSVN